MDTDHIYNRYQRQVILKEFGIAGQQKLLAAKVLVIGAGGLGCPALQYLAAAGIGSIGIIDDDQVSLHNLHRQTIFKSADIGASKAQKAQAYLQQLNEDIQVVAYNQGLDVHNALATFSTYDIIVDGSDNFATRYLVNDACVLLGKPLVYGAVSQFEGQVAVFNYAGESKSTPVNYRDLFPEPPTAGEVLNCAEAGVLGVLPGIIGTMQANETIKIITGMGKPLVNSLLTFNVLTNQLYTLELVARENTKAFIPADEKAFNEMNYEWFCGNAGPAHEIDLQQFNEIIQSGNLCIIDVRELDETPAMTGFHHIKIPLPALQKNIPLIAEENIVVFCQSGKRSLLAARLLQDKYNSSKKIYSLKGGVSSWLRNKQTIQ